MHIFWSSELLPSTSLLLFRSILEILPLPSAEFFRLSARKRDSTDGSSSSVPNAVQQSMRYSNFALALVIRLSSRTGSSIDVLSASVKVKSSADEKLVSAIDVSMVVVSRLKRRRSFGCVLITMVCCTVDTPPSKDDLLELTHSTVVAFCFCFCGCAFAFSCDKFSTYV